MKYISLIYEIFCGDNGVPIPIAKGKLKNIEYVDWIRSLKYSKHIYDNLSERGYDSNYMPESSSTKIFVEVVIVTDRLKDLYVGKLIHKSRESDWIFEKRLINDIRHYLREYQLSKILV